MNIHEILRIRIERKTVISSSERKTFISPTERKAAISPSERKTFFSPTERKVIISPSERKNVISLRDVTAPTFVSIENSIERLTMKYKFLCF